VEYRERSSAAGKIPGGFFKREGRPTAKEILTCRMIDRPIRPLFPDGYKEELQVMATVLSADPDHDPDTIAMVGSSAALLLTGIPFEGPIGAVRVGRVDGAWVANPSYTQLDASDLDLIVAGTADAVTMVEAGSQEMNESDILQAIEFGHEQIREICRVQCELASRFEIEPRPFTPEDPSHPELTEAVDAQFGEAIAAATRTPEKGDRQSAIRSLVETARAELVPEDAEDPRAAGKAISERIHDLVKKETRRLVVEESQRIDGRGLQDIRPIDCMLTPFPRSHGSAIFTRGETQAAVSLSLGTSRDAQFIEGLREEYQDRFYLHYNFPPYCTGEVKPIRGTSRREIGHGALATRALRPILPSEEVFPYTIRIVSDILESNGSSSMASVCGGTLAMMDGGVPIAAPVAGIAMGLVKEGDEIRILTDILGDEDHCGDMDFKVCGTAQGITALQMDIKCKGLSSETMLEALEQARKARLHILDCMFKAIPETRDNISSIAPQIIQIQIDPERIGMVIGPGGKSIKSIQGDTGASVEIEDDGRVRIYASDAPSGEEAKRRIEEIATPITPGRCYDGPITGIKPFGIFVQLSPGQDGMCHVSEFCSDRVQSPFAHFQQGDQVGVKVVEVDNRGKIRLSIKEYWNEVHGKTPTIDDLPRVPEEIAQAAAEAAAAAQARNDDRRSRRPRRR
jgi:polyribonucleotide nucleotidyltransferase